MGTAGTRQRGAETPAVPDRWQGEFPMRITTRRRDLCLAAAMLLSTGTAQAQSTFSPQADWNGTYGFSSASDKNFRLLQSDTIRKGEEGYYESLGKVTLNNNTTNSVSNITNNDIGQQQTTIGVISTATNNIELKNSAGANVDTRNIAESAGCIDSTIHIDSTPTGAARSCN